jgi:hypothetical protein
LKNNFKKLIAVFKFIVSILLAISFILMVLNITFFYGFTPSMINTTNNHANPFELTIPLIWTIHLIAGFLAGMVFSKKRYILAGSAGLLCAFLITGISFMYFGWRESISSVEMLFPLILGILPAVKLYDYLNNKYPKKNEV